MSQFRSDASLNDEITRGGTRFRFDGAKWKRLGQNFDTTAIAEEVAAAIGGGGGGGGGTGAYHGHIEIVSNKDYTLDVSSPVERTITDFYVIAATGGCTAELKGTNGSISTVTVSTTGVTGSLSNTTLPEGGTLELGMTGAEECNDLKFSVRYSQ